MARPVKYTPSQIEKMAQLRAMGYSFRMIGTRYGCTENYAARLVREHNERKGARDED